MGLDPVAFFNGRRPFDVFPEVLFGMLNKNIPMERFEGGGNSPQELRGYKQAESRQSGETLYLIHGMKITPP